MPRADVQHGNAVTSRVRIAKADVLAKNCPRRTSAASHGRHRAGRGHRHHKNQDNGGEEGRPLRGEWTKGLDFPRTTFRPDDPAGKDYSVAGSRKEIRRDVNFFGGSTRIDRRGPARKANSEHGEP